MHDPETVNAEQEAPVAPGTPLEEKPDAREIEDADRRFARALWAETDRTPDYDEAVAQYRKDLAVLEGKASDDRERKVYYHRIIRNRDMIVAMTVPDDHKLEIQPDETVYAGAKVEGGETPEQQMHTGFARTLQLLVQKSGEAVDMQEDLESLVHEGASQRIAVLKLAYCEDFYRDAITGDRPEDMQDNLALLEQLTTEYRQGDFDKDDALFKEMEDLAASLGTRPQIDVWPEFGIDIVPLDRICWSPEVKRTSRLHRARWIREDFYITRRDLLARFAKTGLVAADLEGAVRYDCEGKQLDDEATSRGSASVLDRTTEEQSEDDYLRLREVWKKETLTVYYLVEGVERTIDKWQPQDRPARWYPYHFLVLNQRSASAYGLSHTELQEPIERQIQTLRGDRTEGASVVAPRWLYNKQFIQSDEIITMNKVPPHGGLGVDGDAQTFAQNLFLIPGVGALNEQIYDTAVYEHDQDTAAMLPAQIRGQTGAADFAAEVEAAVSGANINTKRLLRIVHRAVEGVYADMAQILLMKLGQSAVADLIGPEHAQHWPEQAPDREAIYRKLRITVSVSASQQLMFQRHLQNATQFINAWITAGNPANPYVMAELLGRVFNMPEIAQRLLQSDAMTHLQALMTNPQQALSQMGPEGMQALIGLATAAQQLLVQQEEQAVAQAATEADQAAPPVPGADPMAA